MPSRSRATPAAPPRPNRRLGFSPGRRGKGKGGDQTAPPRRKTAPKRRRRCRDQQAGQGFLPVAFTFPPRPDREPESQPQIERGRTHLRGGRSGASDLALAATKTPRPGPAPTGSAPSARPRETFCTRDHRSPPSRCRLSIRGRRLGFQSPPRGEAAKSPPPPSRAAARAFLAASSGGDEGEGVGEAGGG